MRTVEPTAVTPASRVARPYSAKTKPAGTGDVSAIRRVRGRLVCLESAADIVHGAIVDWPDVTAGNWGWPRRRDEREGPMTAYGTKRSAGTGSAMQDDRHGAERAWSEGSRDSPKREEGWGRGSDCEPLGRGRSAETCGEKWAGL